MKSSGTVAGKRGAKVKDVSPLFESLEPRVMLSTTLLDDMPLLPPDPGGMVIEDPLLPGDPGDPGLPGDPGDPGGAAMVMTSVVFYNNSSLDGNDSSANILDDAAIDGMVMAYQPGMGLSSMAITHFSKGINGVMLDVFGMVDSGAVTLSDFSIQVADSADSIVWADYQGQSDLSVRTLDGMERFSITLDDYSVTDQWLKVTMLSTPTTGIAADASYIFGHVSNSIVTSTDQMTITQGSSATVDVSLQYQPAENVTVAIELAGDDNTAIAASTSEITITPENWNQPQQVTFSVQEGPASAASELYNIGAAGMNGATLAVEPIILNNAPQVANAQLNVDAPEGTAFELALADDMFVDVDGDALALTMVDGPEWLSFDSETGTFAGNPDDAQIGQWDVTVRATDPQGAYVDSTFEINIYNVNDAPQVNAFVGPLLATEDVAFDYMLAPDVFTDADAGDNLVITAENLPSWLSFDEATQTLSGTADNSQVGSYEFDLVATDAAGATATQKVIIGVENVNDAPFADVAIESQTIDAGTEFEMLVPADAFGDVDAGDSLTITVASELPAWLSYDPATQTFTGMPQNSDAGELAITLLATDQAGETATTSFTITVERPLVVVELSKKYFSYTETDGDIVKVKLTKGSGTISLVDNGDGTMTASSINITDATMKTTLSIKVKKPRRVKTDRMMTVLDGITADGPLKVIGIKHLSVTIDSTNDFCGQVHKFKHNSFQHHKGWGTGKFNPWAALFGQS